MRGQKIMIHWDSLKREKQKSATKDIAVRIWGGEMMVGLSNHENLNTGSWFGINFIHQHSREKNASTMAGWKWCDLKQEKFKQSKEPFIKWRIENWKSIKINRKFGLNIIHFEREGIKKRGNIYFLRFEVWKWIRFPIRLHNIRAEST